MAVSLDHVTLRTRDLDGTREFLVSLLDMEAGYRPGFPFPGHWLYANGAPIVHLIPGAGVPTDQANEMIDHVGFRLTGYALYLQKLQNMRVGFSAMDLPDLGERRLFVHSPTGILIELVFRDENIPSTSIQEQNHVS